MINVEVILVNFSQHVYFQKTLCPKDIFEVINNVNV